MTEPARTEIITQSGRQFDPTVVEAFLSIPLSRWIELQQDRAQGATPPAAAS